MTGAGAGSLAFVKSNGFLSIPGTPTYYLPGRNPTVNELSLPNQLQRLRTPSNAEAVDSLAGALEGAFGVTYAMSADTHDDVRDIVFNDAGGGFTSGRAALSRWFVGVEHLTSGSTATVERVLKGCIPLNYTITYEQGTNTVRENLSMGYATETRNTSITPSSITSPSDGSTVAFHGTTLTVDAATVTKLQSATLSFQGPMYRFHPGASRTALDATLATPETTLEAGAIYQNNSTQELAYGGSGATSPQDRLTNVSGSLAFDVGGTSVATYSLSKLKPDVYDWQDVINADADMTESTTYHANGGVSVA